LDKRLFEIEIGMKIFNCHGSVGVASFIVLMALVDPVHGVGNGNSGYKGRNATNLFDWFCFFAA